MKCGEKTGWFFGVMLVLTMLLSSCTSGPSVSLARRPAHLPEGSMVWVMQSHADGDTIGISSNVQVLYVEVYGGDYKERAALVTVRDFITFFLPENYWFNFVFLADDGQYHFVSVQYGDWMIKPIVIRSSRDGYGAAMTVYHQ